jgi:hypothetical protein
MAQFRIAIEVEVEADSHEDARNMRNNILAERRFSDVRHFKILRDSVEAVRINIGVSPSEMTGAMIIQGDRILSNFDTPTSSGRFQLIRRADWTTLLNAFPTNSVKETFLDNIIAVWNHTDHPGWCWIQTHA